ncbi:hypothetical protein B0T14DRAFT_566331 [Immersiella caudata]|uniref:Uncharacterized protein n=1 Tax=Immersiella caudata TaxID=314043 RepID=A0AA39WQ26_9PEZI|nr:hypothetical protein B0T14DRAFT_566331 [Immersiella caudata]
MIVRLLQRVFREYTFEDYETYWNDHYKRWMLLSLTCLSTAAALGGISSGFFYADDKIGRIPYQSPAQCFIFTASSASAFCAAIHLLAARQKDRKMFLVARLVMQGVGTVGALYEHPLARYVMANIVAGCLGWGFTVAHFVSIVVSKRPYSLPAWKKRPREELDGESDDGKEKGVKVQRWWPVTWGAEDGNYCTIQESGGGCEYVRRQVLDKAYGEIKKLK